jgi:hypothetical protein
MPYNVWAITTATLCNRRMCQQLATGSACCTQIGTLLGAIRSFDLARAQRRMAAVRHMWTYEYVNAYIERRLATEHQGAPIPKAAFADDPGCDCAPGCGGQC